jgi:phosphopantothenoylcysteine decarboxylase/phosphopantothenate--cysteine ligase
MLEGKHVLLGVTGGIAAYKAADLTSALIKQKAEVDVIMTEHATKFITPLTFESLTHTRSVTDTFDRSHYWEIEHISLADKADILVIAPATADIIAKLAAGIADDMLTTTALACTCPKVLAPAMNTKMYQNPLTQRNLATLRSYGWKIVEPASGRLACGTSGTGKLESPQVILETIQHEIAHEKDLAGLKVLVTAGPTREAVDPVRYLTNHSSGKMGYAIAKAAAQRGAVVILVSGPTLIPKPRFADIVDVISAEDMFKAVTERADKQDIIIKAAAVADFRPLQVADQKMKKAESDDQPSLPLERTHDILAWLGNHKKENQVLCGFSMETEHLLENSRKKLVKKHLDLIAANSLKEAGAGFQTDTNVLTLITENDEIQLPLMTKDEAADALLDQLLEIYREKHSQENSGVQK